MLTLRRQGVGAVAGEKKSKFSRRATCNNFNLEVTNPQPEGNG